MSDGPTTPTREDDASRVTVQTLLGDNAVALLAALTIHLRRSTALDLRLSDGDGARSSDDAGVWDHDLVWACGLVTMRAIESGRATGEIVAAPVFTGETSACYHSVIVAREDGPVHSIADVPRARVAINEGISWSGCQALLAHLADAGRRADFAAVVTSGTHRRSVEAVASGRADVAAIDHTLWQHLATEDPTAWAGLRVVARTADWPAPPFLLGRALDENTRARLEGGLDRVRPGDVAGLERIERCEATRYLPLLDRRREQAALTRDLMGRAPTRATAPASGTR